jgi:HlyD family secretion protein
MNRRWIIVIGAFILVSVIGVLVWTQINNANNARPLYTASDVATAEVGTLIATVSATGSIEPQTETALAFLANGNVAELLVKRGDKVTAGQPLAKLDATALTLQLKQAEANLASAQSSLAKLKQGPSASARALAQANLDSAQAAYDALQNPSASAIAAAQANLDSTRAQYNKLLKPDATELAIAKADVDKAQAALANAQAAYDRIGGASNPNIGQLPQSLQLQSATLDYQKALNAFNAKFNPTDAQVKAAQAQIQQAQDALQRLQPTQENLARAQAQIKQAQDALARLTPATEDIAQAEANVASAAAARDLAQQRVNEATLVAPQSGVVTALDLAEGEFAQAGRPVLTIADLEQLRIALSIDETDIPRVQVGQPVLLDLDAFPDQQVNGVVREIAPAATTLQGVVNYQVIIDVTPGDLAIKPGMTANANVQVARKENVLLVPTRAIRAQGSKRLVTILENGEPQEVTVTLGLSNDQFTEILDGLKPGAQILTLAVSTNAPRFGGFGGSNNATATPQGN